MTVVLGVDPGLASLGWGVLSFDGSVVRHHAHGVIETSAGSELSARLLEIEQKFDAVLSRYRPVAMGYEYQFFVKNVTSGLEVAHALGVVLLGCAKRRIGTQGFTPPAIKKQITGNARAQKDSVEKLMCLALNIDKIRPHHASDALAIALVRCYSMQREGLKSHIAGTISGTVDGAEKPVQKPAALSKGAARIRTS